jgi:hypothetical protein
MTTRDRDRAIVQCREAAHAAVGPRACACGADHATWAAHVVDAGGYFWPTCARCPGQAVGLAVSEATYRAAVGRLRRPDRIAALLDPPAA